MRTDMANPVRPALYGYPFMWTDVANQMSYIYRRPYEHKNSHFPTKVCLFFEGTLSVPTQVVPRDQT
jgi:hypothetical protein